MNKRTLRLLSTTLLIAILLSGCGSIFFLKDQPKVVRDEKEMQTPPLSEFRYLATGNVQGYDPNTQNLLLTDRSSAAPASNAINNFEQGAEYKLSNLVLSDKTHYMARYDKTGEGIYYLQQEGDAEVPADTAIGNLQLIWTSLDKSITKTVSHPDYSVTSPFCFYDDGKVLYANSKNELVVTDHNEYRRVFKNVENHRISRLICDSVLNTIIYIGNTPKDDVKRLYMVELKEGNLEPVLLESDVPYFDYNQETGTLVYIQETESENKIYTYNLREPEPPVILYNGDVQRVFIAPDDSGIFFTRGSQSTDKSLEALYYSDLQGDRIVQITSPLKLVSNVLIEPKTQTLYFSIESTQQTEAAGENMVDAYALQYRLPESE